MIEINDQFDFFKNVKIDDAGNLLVSIVNFTGGTSGGTGSNGSSGSAGTSGSSGESGSSGSSGVSGELGSSGTSGESGSSGSSGISGEIGSSGTSGTSGENGSSGTSGANGANGVSYGFDGYTADNVVFSFSNVGSNITITNVASLNASTLAYEPGQFIIIRSTATPTAFMIAEVISWASAPSLNVNITYVSEEGTFSDVNIHLSGIQGKSNTYLSYSTSATINLDALNINDNINLVVFSSPYSTYQNTTAYSPGQFLIITNSTDSNMYFIASVISYNQTTGDLSVKIKYKTAGSNNLWIANLAGQNGDTLTYLTYTFTSTPIDIDGLNIDDTFYMYLLSNDPSTLILNTGNYSTNQYIIITANADSNAYIICQVLDYTRTDGSAYLKVVQKTTGNYDAWFANLTAITSGTPGSGGLTQMQIEGLI